MRRVAKSIATVVISASLMFNGGGIHAEEIKNERMNKIDVQKTLDEIRAKVNKKSAEINISACAADQPCSVEKTQQTVKPIKKVKDSQDSEFKSEECLQAVKEKSSTTAKTIASHEEKIQLAQAAPLEVKKMETAPAPPTAPAPAAAPSPVVISGYTQLSHTVSDVPADSHSFNVARTRFVFKRKLDEDLSFFSQFNITGNNADSSQMTLTDLFVQYNLDKSQNLMLGQFVVPGNYEATISPRDLYMINYGQHIINTEHENRGNDLRDVGITYNYRKPGDNWGLSIAAVNGEGINTRNDSTDSKTIMARLDLEADKALKLGLYASDGKRFKAASTAAQVAFYGADGAATTAKSFDRKRAGFDARYKKDKLTLQGVYEILETGLAGRAGNLKGKGMFVQAGYFVMPKLELTYKHDAFTPNKDNTVTKRTINAAGFNWFIKKGAKLQMVYQKQKETPEVKNDRLDTLVTVEF